MDMKRKVLIVLGVALGAVLAVGGYSLGASTRPPVDTACVTARNVPSHIYAKNVSCPKGQHKVQWNQQGPAGPAGPSSTSFETLSAPVPANSSGPIPETSSTVTCPTGWFAVGGGFNQEVGADAPQVVTYDGPGGTSAAAPNSEDSTAWTVRTDVPVPGLSATVVCAK
jgi:hypothetical protein